MCPLLQSLRALLAAAALTLAAQPALAQHVHSGDVVVHVDAGKLVIESGEPQAGTGYRIFEGAFTTLLSGNRWTTDDPGFDMEPGTLLPGEQLWVRGLDRLRTWNGSSWAAASPGNTFIRLRDIVEELVVFRPAGVATTAPGMTGLIEAADAGGIVHQHLNFFLLNAASDTTNSGAPVANGAYLIQLQLFSTALEGGMPKYLDSDPFYIAFNRGLSAEAFEDAVHALAVPEPAAALMLLPGLALIAYRLRARAKRG